MIKIEFALQAEDLHELLKSVLAISYPKDIVLKISKNALLSIQLNVAHTILLHSTINLSKRKNTECIDTQIEIKRKLAQSLLRLLKIQRTGKVNAKIDTIRNRMIFNCQESSIIIPYKTTQETHPDPNKVMTKNWCIVDGTQFRTVIRRLSPLKPTLTFMGINKKLVIFARPTDTAKTPYDHAMYFKLTSETEVKPFLCNIDYSLMHSLLSTFREKKIYIGSDGTDRPLAIRQKTKTMLTRAAIASMVLKRPELAEELLNKAAKAGKVPPRWFEYIRKM